ncbi:DNA repair and recombination protein RadB [Candidatus Pacearchaeota archaeon CG10_big_fil_rev_8_21_14_0_10_32_42]|nr:MAG: DNA repair and recombination protein RadB [Candidatus Pacearchaeota archaeon CG10_big_fil_rev_8_21_14_0_10_32_42]
MENSERISTGSFDLNDWLGGGYEKGIVTMLVGPPGSGKSNLSILAACSQAREKKVIFVDSEGGFSLERVNQIVGEDNVEKVLKNILIFNPTNFQEQKKCFSKLLGNVKSENVGLIIVDSMAMLYRLELGDAASENDEEKIREVNRDVARQMRVLVEISRKENIPVLITNQVYGTFLSFEEMKNGVEKESNIVGGDLFKYWSKCIIELKNQRTRKAVLLKHRSLDKKDFNFEIRNEGIFKKGLF